MCLLALSGMALSNAARHQMVQVFSVFPDSPHESEDAGSKHDMPVLIQGIQVPNWPLHFDLPWFLGV